LEKTMRKLIIPAVSALALFAMPALAQPAKDGGKSDKPVTQQEPNAGDVVATPATDLNLKKNEIPPLLLAAEQRPYVLRGLDTCRQLGGAIGELDAVLGDDVDVPQNDGRKMSAGRVAQSVVGSLIPFRGLIRELSGANQSDRALQAAILAGVARRSFLKGIGQGKGCRYPARSATLDVYNMRMAALNAGEEPYRPGAADAEPQGRAGNRATSQGGEPRAVRYVARPVVQRD
jgi:hypothetical protein